MHLQSQRIPYGSAAPLTLSSRKSGLMQSSSYCVLGASNLAATALWRSCEHVTDMDTVGMSCDVHVSSRVIGLHVHES